MIEERPLTIARVAHEAPQTAPSHPQDVEDYRQEVEEGLAALAGARQDLSRIRVAIVDDDPALTQVLSSRLAAIGWELSELSGAESDEALVSKHLHALVLDVAALGPSGWAYLEHVCTRLPNLVVIVCAGPSSVAERVRGLRLGAAAWLSKPCHSEELICMIQAAIRLRRRAARRAAGQDIVVGEVTLRPALYQAYVGDSSLELTTREFEFFRFLAQSDHVMAREEIYERVWGYAMTHGDRSVDVYVRKLRQKLRDASPRWRYIHTHKRVGYRFAPTPESANWPNAVAHEEPAEAPSQALIARLTAAAELKTTNPRDASAVAVG